MAASLVVAHRVEHVDAGGAARRHGGADDPHDDGEDEEEGELADRQREPEPEVPEGRRRQRGEQDADRGAEQRADDGGDDALVADDPPDLAPVAPTARSSPNSRVRSWTARKRLLAIPNSEITRLIASSA